MLVQDLDTPCAVVDLDVMENNLRRCQTYLDRHGLRLRPHIKTCLLYTSDAADE